MIIALSYGGARVRANKVERRAFCPECEGVVIAKCGEHVVWHWAHESHSDCNYGGGEGEWHRQVKMMVKDDYLEVRREKNGQVCVADILLPLSAHTETCIEVQRSGISDDDIARRESFWGRHNVRWILDGTRYVVARWRGDTSADLEVIDKETHSTFRWKRAQKRALAMTHPILDLNAWAMDIRRLRHHRSGAVYGWGYEIDRSVMVTSRQEFWREVT